jgi:hypothetical protein
MQARAAQQRTFRGPSSSRPISNSRWRDACNCRSLRRKKKKNAGPNSKGATLVAASLSGCPRYGLGSGFWIVCHAVPWRSKTGRAPHDTRLGGSANWPSASLRVRAAAKGRQVASGNCLGRACSGQIFGSLVVPFESSLACWLLLLGFYQYVPALFLLSLVSCNCNHTTLLVGSNTQAC